MKTKVIAVKSVAAQRTDFGFEVRRLMQEAVGEVNIRAVHAMIPPGCSNGPHVQERLTEVLYYVAGQPTVEIEGGETYTMEADTLIVIPPGVSHTHRNSGTEPVVQIFFGVQSE